MLKNILKKGDKVKVRQVSKSKWAGSVVDVISNEIPLKYSNALVVFCKNKNNAEECLFVDDLIKLN